MKTIGKYLLCASLLASIGCVGGSTQARRDGSRGNVATKPDLDEDDDDKPAAPAPVALLPADQLNSSNAHEQANAMHAALIKEQDEMKKAAAERD